MKEATHCISIYFPEIIWEIINKRIKVTGRSKTNEVIHLVTLGLKYGQEADVRALSQLKQHLPEDIAQL